ncbi:DUF2336 domain-containing protein [Phreatobacter aquaticus]|uniref:DUF2336 domain-containing protein n=1 Tax=Phreatobacter aquaticus TaxID=2570229 RepID=A0A4D7QK90_9HYPH|nr:DUF2336 domain-containing protein [Phreatobacter aquaticus]QCK85657.1 DUF2336 domain-containing protein [Phreatobacter aquaticus]
MAATEKIIEELEDVIENGPSNRRVETLRRVTDLFLVDAARYTHEQVALFDDVITRLGLAMETAARQELAMRLAPVPNAPPTIIRSLAQDDEIDVARPILLLCSQLDDSLLAEIAKTKSNEHRLAISRRPVVAEKVTDTLVAHGDGKVMLSLASNNGARISDAGFVRLVQRAKADDLLAECVGMRADIPPFLFRVILENAKSQVQERLIAASAARDQAQVRATVAGIADRIAVGSADSRDLTAIHRAMLGRQRKGELTEAALKGFADQKLFDETVCALSLLCGVKIDMVERLFLGERPDPILILARSIGLAWPTLKAILKIRPGSAGTSETGIEEIRETYAKLTANTALRVLRFWQIRDSSAQAS